MQEEAVLPTSITCVSTVDACTNDIELDLVHRMHTRSMNIDLGEEAVIWQSVLINIYGKCKNFNFASRVFVKMQEKNVISWTTMINVCKQMDRGTDAHKYFQQMQQEGILPNKHTWVTIIASCAGDSDLILGRQIHASLHVSQFDTDSVMGSALIDMYDKCNSLVEAEMIFKTLLMPNIVAWTAMINSYCHHGYEELAFSLFDRMKHDGLVPNKATFIAILGACVSPEMLNTGKHLHESIHKQGFECDACVATGLINMYARCGSLEDAKALFKCLPKSDVVFWNSMLGAYGLFGRVDKAFETFDLMQNLRVTPTKSTYLNLLAVLMTDAARLHETRSVHNCIVEAGLESDTAIENALINIYGKSASLTDAQKVFSKIYNRDVSIWSSMISIHAGNGFGERALYLFSKMQDDKVSPDEITLTSALVACSQAGLLDEAYRLFTLMEEIHNCIPVLHHYVCMMDVLGRAGLLEDLAILMKHMPFQPGSVPITASMSFYWRYISIQMCLEIV
ncbi:hypothetical protein KP509_02G053100 [Ceratopteris richardii]|nr:hypothetical protein KP509_02G053100 [Ceratopteris richardii]